MAQFTNRDVEKMISAPQEVLGVLEEMGGDPHPGRPPFREQK